MKIKSYFTIPNVDYKFQYSFDDDKPSTERKSLISISKYRDVLHVESIEQLYNDYFGGDIELCPFCGRHYECCDFDMSVDRNTNELKIVAHKREKHMCNFKDCARERKKYNPNSVYFVSMAYKMTEEEANRFIIERNKSPFYFHPESESEEEYKNRQRRTLEWFVERYGEEEGKKRYEKRNRATGYGTSLEGLTEKYGLEMAKEICNKKAITMENLVSKYGDEEGRERYQKWIEKISMTSSDDWKKKTYSKERYEQYRKNKHYTTSRQYVFDNYGLEEGIKILKKRGEKQRKQYWLENYGEEYTKERCEKLDTHSLKSFVRRYGDEGEKKYIEYMQNYYKSRRPDIHNGMTGEYVDSRQACDFFIKLHEMIKTGMPDIKDEDIYYADGKGRKEYRIDYIYDNHYRWCRLDFAILSLKVNVEFNGEYYHPIPDADESYIKEWQERHTGWDYYEKVESQKIRNNAVVQNNFNVIDVWDTEMNYGAEPLILKETYNKIKQIYEKTKQNTGTDV